MELLKTGDLLSLLSTSDASPDLCSAAPRCRGGDGKTEITWKVLKRALAGGAVASRVGRRVQNGLCEVVQSSLQSSGLGGPRPPPAWLRPGSGRAPACLSSAIAFC